MKSGSKVRVNGIIASPLPQLPFDFRYLPASAIDHPPSTSFVGMVNCCGFKTFSNANCGRVICKKSWEREGAGPTFSSRLERKVVPESPCYLFTQRLRLNGRKVVPESTHLAFVATPNAPSAVATYLRPTTLGGVPFMGPNNQIREV